MNGEMMILTLLELYTMYMKNQDNSFFIYTYLLTCLNKNTSVLLKVINI